MVRSYLLHISKDQFSNLNQLRGGIGEDHCISMEYVVYLYYKQNIG